MHDAAWPLASNVHVVQVGLNNMEITQAFMMTGQIWIVAGNWTGCSACKLTRLLCLGM